VAAKCNSDQLLLIFKQGDGVG